MTKKKNATKKPKAKAKMTTPAKANLTKSAYLILLIVLLSAIALALIFLTIVSNLSESIFVHRTIVGNNSFKNFDTFEQVQEYLSNREKDFLNKRVLWTSPNGDIELSMSDLGVTGNTEEANNELAIFMSNGNLDGKIKTLIFGKKIKHYVTIPKEKIQEAFKPAAIEQGIGEASYHWEGGTLNVLPSQIGIGLDMDELVTTIEGFWADQKVPQTYPVPLRTSNPEYTEEMLNENLENASKIAQMNIKLVDTIGDKWTLPMQEYMDYVLPDKQGFSFEEENVLVAIKELLASDFETEPQNAVVSIDENGKYSFEGSARRGRKIDETSLVLRLSEQINTYEDGEITIPSVTVEPTVTVPDSLKELGVTDLVGYGYSNFSGSPWNRIQNVKRGMAQFNGVLIAPGEEFSFTSLMGPIDASHGWLPELVIKGNDTIPEYGGGLCQVSSTMFRAALYSGLDITARRNHSYAVSYYAYPFGYGLDATVYDPNPDFRFINDTSGHLLIQGYTEGNTAYFVFYGTYDGRTVEMDGPYAYNYRKDTTPKIEITDELPPGERKQKEYAHTGFDVDWYRTIISGTGAIGEKETIHSSYEARPPQYYEGAPAASDSISLQRALTSSL